MADDVDLFAALRPELDGAMLQVSWSDVAGCAGRVVEYRPWPWAVCGTGVGPDPTAVAAVIRRPVIWFWLGTAPRWFPPHGRVHARWRDLLADVRTCLDRSLAGVSLAPNRGLIGPGRELVLSPELEALVASSPTPVTMARRAEGPLNRVLARHRLPLTLVRDQSGIRAEEPV